MFIKNLISAPAPGPQKIRLHRLRLRNTDQTQCCEAGLFLGRLLAFEIPPDFWLKNVSSLVAKALLRAVKSQN